MMKIEQHLSIVVSLALIILTMLVKHAKSLRVAVLGSGISGATAARTLADRGVEVTVFEVGFGIGGRTSTRITRDGHRYQFDHGAQYISAPKTDLFRGVLDQWKADGWVKEWSGNFCTADGSTGGVEMEKKGDKERWVGVPGMHSICRNLLHHENIRVQLQTRADAVVRRGEGGEDSAERWELIHSKTKKSLGPYDWLIATDRNSGAHFRNDLKSAGVNEFRSGVRSIESVKSLTAMVVLEQPLELDMDGIQFVNNGGKGAPSFGSLGWAARDTSKPGRDRNDGKECWVLQSHPDAAREILGGTKMKTQEIRDKAKEVLVHDFLKSVPILAGSNKDVASPQVATAIGHRWGAAFPIPSPEFVAIDSRLVADKHFVACGDYFGTLSGRIEGAYLSGLSAANQLCKEIEL